MSDDIAIKVENLTKIYKLYDSPQDRLKESLHPLRKKYHKDFYALNDVSFEIKKGETVGIIGQNGAGKSTLLKVITGVLTPSSGSVTVNGRVSALLELGAGFNPQLTGLENVYFNGTLMGYTREQMDARLDDILAFADIGDFIHQPVKTYSSGMFVRLAFAAAVHIEPEILIVDEALSVGDMMFQAKCYEKIKSLMSDGCTTLFVTHNMNTITTLCGDAYMLDGGKIYTQGLPKDVTLAYYRLQRERELARQSSKTVLPAKPDKTSHVETGNTELLKSKERFGTGAARIFDFKILNHEGQETDALQTGKLFKVVMKVVFHDFVSNPCFGLMIRNPQGQSLLGIHSYHEHRLYFGEKKADDELIVTFEGEMLLNPGKYILGMAISDHTTDLEYINIDAVSNIATLNVYGKEFSFGIIHNIGKVTVESA